MEPLGSINAVTGLGLGTEPDCREREAILSLCSVHQELRRTAHDTKEEVGRLRSLRATVHQELVGTMTDLGVSSHIFVDPSDDNVYVLSYHAGTLITKTSAEANPPLRMNITRLTKAMRKMHNILENNSPTQMFTLGELFQCVCNSSCTPQKEVDAEEYEDEDDDNDDDNKRSSSSSSKLYIRKLKVKRDAVPLSNIEASSTLTDKCLQYHRLTKRIQELRQQSGVANGTACADIRKQLKLEMQRNEEPVKLYLQRQVPHEQTQRVTIVDDNGSDVRFTIGLNRCVDQDFVHDGLAQVFQSSVSEALRTAGHNTNTISDEGVPVAILKSTGIWKVAASYAGRLWREYVLAKGEPKSVFVRLAKAAPGEKRHLHLVTSSSSISSNNTSRPPSSLN